MNNQQTNIKQLKIKYLTDWITNCNIGSTRYNIQFSNHLNILFKFG
jgi:hypothetical protein